MKPHHLISLLLLVCLSGCDLAGVAASKLLPPQKILPAYKGLLGHSVGIMVWADRGLKLDYPSVQLDIASGLQNKFHLAQTIGKSKDLLGTTFPVKPESIVKYQQTYPQIDAMDITDVAPKIGPQRLIYIEINDFSTRPDPQVELYRGTMTASIKVLAIVGGKAKVVYTDNDVRAIFPKTSGEDGIPNVGDYPIYRGLTDAFTTEAIHRFVTYESEDDD
jgi:hypothetical protein